MSETNFRIASPINPPKEPVAEAPAPIPTEAGIPDPTPAPAAPTGAATSAPPSLELGAAPRPAWLPPQYKTPEDAMRALEHAQAKIAGKTDSALLTETDLQGYMQEVVSGGSLSDGSRRALRAKGFTDALIDQHVAGLQAIREGQMSRVFAVAGGQENYGKLSEWASKALSPVEQSAYNEAVGSGNPGIIAMAVAGLKARFDLANGAAPAGPAKSSAVRLSGSSPTGAQGVAMFRNMSEQVRAQKDPRYNSDPGYRAKVEAMIDAALKARAY